LDSLGQVYSYRGEYEEAAALASANLAAMPADRYREYFGGSLGIVTATSVRGRLIHSLAHLGRFAEGAAHTGELLAFAEATQHVYARSLAYHTVGVYHLIKGEWEQAHTWFDRQIAALRGGGITSDIVVALSHDARTLAHLGRTEAALELVRECETALAIQMREGIAHGWSQVTLARACFFVGRLDEAQSLADQVQLPPGGRTDFIASFHLLRGDLASAPRRIDPTRAAACYGEAVAVGEARGMRPTIGCGHLGLGQLAARVGEKDAAREHLHIAASMFREMEMPAWLEWAEGAVAAL
jgi:ATP/maltotriose-dependent transcriptional regulator MalT